jgi:hypothetical protein
MAQAATLNQAMNTITAATTGYYQIADPYGTHDTYTTEILDGLREMLVGKVIVAHDYIMKRSRVLSREEAQEYVHTFVPHQIISKALTFPAAAVECWYQADDDMCGFEIRFPENSTEQKSRIVNIEFRRPVMISGTSSPAGAVGASGSSGMTYTITVPNTITTTPITINAPGKMIGSSDPAFNDFYCTLANTVN